MKKSILFMLIMIFGFIFMPVVHAADIPREGVTYFLQYPNGTEEVEENYDNAITRSNEEVLILSGETNSNGEVIFNGIANQGEVRIKQIVPDGYSTNERELYLNLSKEKNVEFRNTSGLLNPKTGRTLVVMFLLICLVLGSTILVKKNKKTALLIIPLVALGLMLDVKAGSDDLVIKVKDDFGSPLSGVRVEVYAKPYNIDAQPAVKFSSNEGHFFDGKTLMYFRIPSNNCSFSDFMDSLSENEYYYLNDNHLGAYRDGYRITSPLIPETLSNGTVVDINWQEDSDAQTIKIHGNGGTLDFYGTKLIETHEYKYTYNGMRSNIYNYTNSGKYNSGYSNESTCSNMNSYGVYKNPTNIYDYENTTDLYYCWHDKPDGIYINDEVFIGSKDDCFSARGTSDLRNYSSHAHLGLGDYSSLVYLQKEDYNEDYYDYFMMIKDALCVPCSPECPCTVATNNNYASNQGGRNSIGNQGWGKIKTVEINKLEVIYHGNTIVSFDKNDFQLLENVGFCNYGSTCKAYDYTVDAYAFINDQKLNTLKNYIEEVNNSTACPHDLAEGPVLVEEAPELVDYIE